MKIPNPIISVCLILVAAVLVTIAYLHGNSDATRGMMFTFSGGIVTGAFAFLNGDKKQMPDPSDLPPNSLQQSTIQTGDAVPTSPANKEAAVPDPKA
jgi:hypothetical protein